MNANQETAVADMTLPDTGELLIREFTFDSKKGNEVLLFLKPECFLAKTTGFSGRIIEMVMNKIREYNAEVSGSLLLSGKRLEELGIMDRHYGFINKMSRNASKTVTEKELLEIQKGLEISDFKEYKVLGGHEFLLEFKEFSATSLNKLWLEKKSSKLRSGFYFQKYLVNGKNIVLVNGFHPEQLEYFTNPSHKILVLLLHSDTSWKTLKNDLAGNTFPEKAALSSIRGELFSKNMEYGLPSVSIVNNCVHLSAGPFEALFEINNFLKSVKAAKFEFSKTNMFKLMTKRKISQAAVENCLNNPTARINEKATDLFTLTEDQDSSAAIAAYESNFAAS